MSNPQQKAIYYPGVDGLRAIAVLAVMLFHLRPGLLPGGFTGVDVFFVISGYVVTSVLVRDAVLPFHRFITAFYARRILRIFPALLACLVVTMFATTALIPEGWLGEANRSTGLGAFFGWSNFALLASSDGYFSTRTDFNPFVHTWSLAVEEQFYLLFPPILFCWVALERQGKTRMARVGFAVLMVASFVGAALEGASNPGRAFYLLPSRFWELAFGVLVFKLQQSWGARGWRPFLQWGGAALVLGGFWICDEAAFPYPWAIVPVFGSALLVWTSTEKREGGSWLDAVLESPIMVWIGRRSYSLYLWHWPVFVLLRWTTGIDSWTTAGFGLALTVALAVGSFHAIEEPFRRSRMVLAAPRWAVVLVGVVVVGTGWRVARKISYSGERISLSTTADRTTWYPDPLDPSNLSPDHRIAIEDHVAGGVFVQVFRPDHSRADGRRLFVAGDSHAGAYRRMLQSLAVERGIEVRLFFRGGCAMANFLEPVSAMPEACREFVVSTERMILDSLRQGDLVFLASLKTVRLSDQWVRYDSSRIDSLVNGRQAERDRTAALQDVDAFASRMAKKGAILILDGVKPVFQAPPFRCADGFNRQNPICAPGFRIARQSLLDHTSHVQRNLSIFATSHPGFVVLWEPFPLLCPGDTCDAFREGKPLFYDADHLSGFGNEVLAPEFARLVDSLIGR